MIKNAQTSDRKINIVSIAVLIILTVCSFVAFFALYMPLDFDNLGGKHAWVSGSTIKYVNMWLEEGAFKLKFTNYELFPSIELTSLEDRLPYVSYPTGVTFMVWLGAKLCGLSHIDVNFLKHFQLVMYALENVMLSVLIYTCLMRCTTKNWIRVAGSYLITMFWMTIPVNNWFLTNIYWTDLAVIIWIVAFLMLECLSDKELVSDRTYNIIIAFKCFVVFAGVMTEYYFWIVVFFAFIVNAIRLWFCSKAADVSTNGVSRLKKVAGGSLQYVIPVIVGLLVYIRQMSYTQNWLAQLTDTFLHRTGASDNEANLQMFIKNFCEAITYGSKSRAVLLIGAEVVIVALITVKTAKIRSKNIFSDKCIAVIAFMIATPVLQIFIFSNHSAIHQYSMTKLGLNLVGCVVALIWCGSIFKNTIVRSGITAIMLIAILIALGYPTQTRNYYYEKNKVLDYSIDKVLYEQTGYEDVCFSFTYAVANNPPMDICVSEKCVYMIEDVEDAYNMFANLPASAKKLLVIDKNNIGSNDYEYVEKTADIIAKEEECVSLGRVRYEDEVCVLIELP